MRKRAYNKGPVTIEEIKRHCQITASGCWEWQRSRDRQGYGQIRRAGKLHYVTHQVMHLTSQFELNATNQCILHRCDNPPCVNPDHLFIGTHADNVRDKVQKRRHNYGVTLWKATLNEQLVLTIRTLKAEGGRPKAIAAQLGVTIDCVNSAVRNWKHIK